MSLENLTNILVSDFKIDREHLRRVFRRKKLFVDGYLVRRSDIFFYPIIKQDTSIPHHVDVDGKKILIPKRTDWE